MRLNSEPTLACSRASRRVANGRGFGRDEREENCVFCCGILYTIRKGASAVAVVATKVAALK